MKLEKSKMSSYGIFRVTQTNPIALVAPLVVVGAVWLVHNWAEEDALEMSASMSDSGPFEKSDHGLVLFDLPNIDREPSKVNMNGLTNILPLLQKYEVSPLRGFLPQRDPLQSLSGKYEKWEDLVKNVSDLILAKQIRTLIDRLPVIVLMSSSHKPSYEGHI